jgi:hypothetical protein
MLVRVKPKRNFCSKGVGEIVARFKSPAKIRGFCKSLVVLYIFTTFYSLLRHGASPEIVWTLQCCPYSITGDKVR